MLAVVKCDMFRLSCIKRLSNGRSFDAYQRRPSRPNKQAAHGSQFATSVLCKAYLSLRIPFFFSLSLSLSLSPSLCMFRSPCPGFPLHHALSMLLALSLSLSFLALPFSPSLPLLLSRCLPLSLSLSVSLSIFLSVSVSLSISSSPCP